MIRRTPGTTPGRTRFPYTTLFRSVQESSPLYLIENPDEYIEKNLPKNGIWKVDFSGMAYRSDRSDMEHEVYIIKLESIDYYYKLAWEPGSD